MSADFPIIAVPIALRCRRAYHAELAQLVERNLAKVEVAGSSPVFRSSRLPRSAGRRRFSLSAMLTLGPAQVEIRLSVDVEGRCIDVPVRWAAAHDSLSAGGVQVEAGMVPGEPVWIARLSIDADSYVVKIAVDGVRDAAVDERLGIVELPVERGAIVLALMPDPSTARSATRDVWDENARISSTASSLHRQGSTAVTASAVVDSRLRGNDDAESRKKGLSPSGDLPVGGSQAGHTITRSIRARAATVALAFGADGLHARAALFPFLSGARCRAGLAAARFAQSSGASSSS